MPLVLTPAQVWARRIVLVVLIAGTVVLSILWTWWFFLVSVVSSTYIAITKRRRNLNPWRQVLGLKLKPDHDPAP